MPIFAGLAHHLIPKTYESRTTILVQEPGRLVPFLNDLALATNVKDRMPTLEALLKSKNILGSVLEDTGEISANTEPQTKEIRVKRLAAALSVQLTGSELVELKLRWGRPEGLAKTLGAVTRRFIERLVSPERGAVENSETFFNQQLAERRAELSAAEQAYADFKMENADKLPAMYSTDVSHLAAMQQKLEEKSMELATAEAVFDELRTRLSSLNPVVGRLEESIVQVSSELAALRVRYTDEHSEVRAAERKLRRLEEERAGLLASSSKMNDIGIDQLWNMAAGTAMKEGDAMAPLLSSQMQRVQEAESRRSALRKDVEQLKAGISDLRSAIATFAPIEQRQQQLERAVAGAREMHDLLAKRYEMARLTGSLGSYEAPEQIKIIDPPQDPTEPTTPSGFIFALAGLVGGLALGAGLVVSFEVLDPRLRSPDSIGNAACLPIVAFVSRVKRHAIV
jgi:polysaccharide chain length determinant protein (PEP-CTERM system associated)